MRRLEVAAAAALLGCRHGATRTEVQAAYRRTLHSARPDLGAVDGEWLPRVQAARELLLACAPPERRRRPRRDASAPAAFLPLRRSAWGLVEKAASRLEIRL